MSPMSTHGLCVLKVNIMARACQTAPSRPECRVATSAFSENSDRAHRIPLSLLQVSVDFYHEALHIQMHLHIHDTDKQYHIIVTD